MLNKKNFSVRALLGAGFPLLASLTFAGAQTVPIHSYSAASYPATTPYYAPVSTVGYSTISPTIVPATATYDVLYNTYAATPPTAAPIQPCPVLNDYDAYFAQLYGHASGASANGCVTSTNLTVYPHCRSLPAATSPSSAAPARGALWPICAAAKLRRYPNAGCANAQICASTGCGDDHTATSSDNQCRRC